MKIRNKIDPIVLLDDEEEDIFFFEKAYRHSELENPLITFQIKKDFEAYLKNVIENNNPMPALMIIDINLGNESGFEIVKDVRSNDTFSKIPAIMMLTSAASLEHRLSTKRAGANGFAVKPQGKKDYVNFLNSIYWV